MQNVANNEKTILVTQQDKFYIMCAFILDKLWENIPNYCFFTKEAISELPQMPNHPRFSLEKEFFNTLQWLNNEGYIIKNKISTLGGKGVEITTKGINLLNQPTVDKSTVGKNLSKWVKETFSAVTCMLICECLKKAFLGN